MLYAESVPRCVAASPDRAILPGMTGITVQSASIPAAAADKPPAPALKINGRNKAAIDCMVWEGLTRADAAAKAGLKDHALYVALTKPHVKAYYMQQCEVLRVSGRARRIHRLEAMLEQSDNKAAVINAALALESIGTDQATANAAQSAQPGVIIQIVTQAPAARASVIEHDPHEAISST